MNLSEYIKYDALGLAGLVSERQVSPEELLNCVTDMISLTQEHINAVAYFDPGLAGGRKKDPGGLFGGVPFLVKELLPYPGLITGMGSRLFKNYIPPSGSGYTRRIDESGLITIGNTTSSELGLLGSTETLAHGTTGNPWNPAFSAGGSSGGSAAAVASGVVPMAHANDGGGSIRIPASMCGLFGFKPSADRCVASGENTGPFTDLVSDHCISRSVRDSAAFLSITENSGKDSVFEPVGFCRESDIKGIRIGVYTKTLMGKDADIEIKKIIEKTALFCEELGHNIEVSAGPDIDGKAVSEGFFTLAGSMINQVAGFMEPLLNRELNEDDLEPFTLSLLHWFRKQDDNAMERTLSDLKLSSEKMRSFAKKYDVLLCPTLPCAPKKPGYLSPELDRETLIKRTEEFAGYTPVHNIAGMCAMSVPLFLNDGGLPAGSHFAALPGADKILFDLAYQMEAALPWQDRLPLFKNSKRD